MSDPALQVILYQTSGAWFEGLGLDIDGIDLGDAMKYDVLRISGRLLERGNGDGRTDAKENQN